ncbi:hypothetical protein ACFRCI_42270 [Streptomyces sp. NPDC056638]|uniref:hypothetical protein n=1 Tax=Streptomyces sp. NPDC056638 TaxID=3345887 RepID=UPI0036A7BBF8
MNRTAEDLDRLVEEFHALPAAGDRKREIAAELDDVPDPPRRTWSASMRPGRSAPTPTTRRSTRP